jgi:hypothetical protein
MLARLRRASVLVVTLLLGGSAVHAQGILAGELLAGEVAGYVVIACYADPEVGCDEDLSLFVAIEASGTRAAWSIESAVAGPFLLLAWHDADGDGEAQEVELVVLTDAAGGPVLLTAPASGLVLRGPGAPAAGAASPTRTAPSGARAAAPTAPGADAGTPGTLPTELVGVWQQTRASGGDYRDLVSGNTFSMTSGFTTILKLRADGGFQFQFYSSGTAPGCAFVSTLDTSFGSAQFQDGALVLWPAERAIENTNCSRSGSTALADPEPIRLGARLTEGFDRENHRMWTLALDGGPVPLQLTLLHRPPAADPPRPAFPADFVLGSDSPYDVLQGVWSANHHSDLGFFDPATDAWYLPEGSFAKHLWVRFTPGGYDLARAWPDYAFGQGSCGKDYVYYERGRAELSVIEARGESSYRGHARFVADDARLIVNLRNCGDDDVATQYRLAPQTSYFAWEFGAASNTYGPIPATLSLQCPWELSEWQFMVCDGSSIYGASLTPR